MTDRSDRQRAPRRGPFYGLAFAGSFLAGLCVLTMMAVGAIDIIGTAFFGLPLPGAYEGTATLLVASVFLALALSQAEGRTIRVELLLERLPRRGRAGFDVLAHALTAVFWGFVAWYGWSIAVESTRLGEYTSGAINFPVWPAKVCLAAGATLLVAQALWDFAVAAHVAVTRDTE